MDINIIWDNEELEAIEELNEIFNLQEGRIMKQIEVYSVDFEEIADICEDNNVDEWEVIEAMLEAIRDEKIDISEWLQEV